MKAKYEKMIDEYVKKHYGDLERGVLAPEVKYKVLFKLYRKKYKKEKALRKSLEKMYRYAPTVVPKEEAHAGYWGKLNEFEDKEGSYLDWMHDDITWCRRECSDKDCERNKVNRRCKEGLFSAADMFDPFKCPVDAELPKQP